MRTSHRVKNVLGVVFELLLVVGLGLAITTDIVDAGAKCDTAFDCSAACVDYENARTSEELVETTRRFKTGTQSLKCGQWKIYRRLKCAGDPAATYDAFCPNNCCR